MTSLQSSLQPTLQKQRKAPRLKRALLLLKTAILKQSVSQFFRVLDGTSPISLPD